VVGGGDARTQNGERDRDSLRDGVRRQGGSNRRRQRSVRGQTSLRRARASWACLNRRSCSWLLALALGSCSSTLVHGALLFHKGSSLVLVLVRGSLTVGLGAPRLGHQG